MSGMRDETKVSDEDVLKKPAWLSFHRAVMHDGYTVPIYPDCSQFDAKRIVKDVIKVKGNVLRFQPLGSFAYYPSKHFPVAPELKNRDILQEVIDEVRRAGLIIYCYMPYGCALIEPDVVRNTRWENWVRRLPDGSYDLYSWHYGWNRNIAVCSLNHVYRKDLLCIVRELAGYDIDAVYLDAPNTYVKYCFCASCQQEFKRLTGNDIMELAPAIEKKPVDPALEDAWRAWRQRTVKEDLQEIRKILTANKKAMLVHNGGWKHPGVLHEAYQFADGFMIEHRASLNERMLHGLLGTGLARSRQQVSQMYLSSMVVGGTSDGVTRPRHHTRGYNVW